MVQTAIVSLIVVAAFAYSAWALMPAAWQRGLRRRLGLATPLDAGGCGGCGGGCAAPPKPGSSGPAGPTGSAGPSGSAAPGAKWAVVTLHRRLPASGDTVGPP
jgi:hypothetical protein